MTCLRILVSLLSKHFFFFWNYYYQNIEKVVWVVNCRYFIHSTFNMILKWNKDISQVHRLSILIFLMWPFLAFPFHTSQFTCSVLNFIFYILYSLFDNCQRKSTIQNTTKSTKRLNKNLSNGFKRLASCSVICHFFFFFFSQFCTDFNFRVKSYLLLSSLPLFLYSFLLHKQEVITNKQKHNPKQLNLTKLNTIVTSNHETNPLKMNPNDSVYISSFLLLLLCGFHSLVIKFFVFLPHYIKI